jgi:CxxC motif-containing protein (DUF1111 family)
MTRLRSAGARSIATAAIVMMAATALSQSARAQAAMNVDNFGRGARLVDPGVRGGAPGAGGPLPGLSDTQQQYFSAATAAFGQVQALPDGLGPRFNLDGCGGCHAYPMQGGTSPPTNPQVEVATKAGARNIVPPFISVNGPIREARFIRNPDGSPDGSVHNIFVITGRSDAPGCKIRQPDFVAALHANNITFRIPTPTFGLGLVEAVPDDALEAALAANAYQKRALGISGRFNRSGNDGTITRFGWKAQNKSLLIFAGEAYNVEQGVTNELFPNERETDPNCRFTNMPEDQTPLTPISPSTGSPSADFASTTTLFAAFMRLLAPPTPASSTGMVASAASITTVPSASASASVNRGRQIFSNVGCEACHLKSMTTGHSSINGFDNATFEPLSDFALHDMGWGLADGVSQGLATGREFRTAPLWGVGQRLFFLHDGRANNLIDAIEQHASPESEANVVIHNYNALSVTDKQALLNYLRSL